MVITWLKSCWLMVVSYCSFLLFGERPLLDKRDDKEAETGKAREILLAPNIEEEEFQLPSLGMLWTWSILLFDLLKLENHIPFFILTTLFHLLIALVMKVSIWSTLLSSFLVTYIHPITNLKLPLNYQKPLKFSTCFTYFI